MTALDGIRGVWILFCLGVHTGTRFVPGEAIEVFFVLSGFLITGLLLKEHDRTGGIRLRQFYARRALRLLPALVVCLLVTEVALVAASPYWLKHQSAGVLPVLTYWGNWQIAVHHDFLQLGPFGHTWSLSVEEQFYLLWPLALLLLLRRSARTRTLLAVCAGGAVAALVTRIVLLTGHPGERIRVYTGTDCRADALLIGAALAILMARMSPQWRRRWLERPARWLHPFAWTWVLFAVLHLHTFDLSRAGEYRLFTFGEVLTALSAVVIYVRLISAPRCWTARLMDTRPAQFTGAISYSLYVWHIPIYMFVGMAFTFPAHHWLVLAESAASYAVAVASYYAVERPFLRRKRRHAVVELGAPAGAATPEPPAGPTARPPAAQPVPVPAPRATPYGDVATATR